jgi:hypothetical protein
VRAQCGARQQHDERQQIGPTADGRAVRDDVQSRIAATIGRFMPSSTTMTPSPPHAR